MKAFRMHLKPGCKEEYKRRHGWLRPEMREVMKNEVVDDCSNAQSCAVLLSAFPMELFGTEPIHGELSGRKWYHQHEAE